MQHKSQSKKTFDVTEINKQIRLNLKKLEGFITLLNRMVDQERYCPEIMQQVLASIGILKRIHALLLAKHLKKCFIDAAEELKNSEYVDQKIEEIIQSVDMFNRK